MTAVLHSNVNGIGTNNPGTSSTMRYTLVDGRTVFVTAKLMTPDEAATLLLLNTKNRNVSADSLHKLVTAMLSCQYLFTGDTIKIVRDQNGLEILGDGQHRLEAIVKTGIPVDVLLVENLDPVAMKFLDQQRNRKVGDILRMVYDKKDLKNHTVMTGIAKILMGGYEDRFSSADRVQIAEWISEGRTELLQTWANWARSVSDECGSVQMNGRGASRSMTASPLGALAMVMVDQGANEELVKDFFFRIASGLVSDSDLSNVIPAIRKRQNKGIPLVSGGSGGSQTPLLSEFSVYINAYNKWVIGDPIQVIQGTGSPVKTFSDLPKASKFGQ